MCDKSNMIGVISSHYTPVAYVFHTCTRVARTCVYIYRIIAPLHHHHFMILHWCTILFPLYICICKYAYTRTYIYMHIQHAYIYIYIHTWYMHILYIVCIYIYIYNIEITNHTAYNVWKYITSTSQWDPKRHLIESEVWVYLHRSVPWQPGVYRGWDQ